MRSLATLGVPPLAFGNAEGGIPLPRITDVAWRDAASVAPPIHEMAGSIPLSRLTDVLWRDAGITAPLIHTGEAEGGAPVPAPTDAIWRDLTAAAPSGQDGIGAASTNAWNGWERADAVPLTPSPDPRSQDLARPTGLGEAAYAPNDEQTAASADLPQQSENGRWSDNVPRIVVTPQQFEPWMTPEGRPDTSPYRSDWQVYQPAAVQADQNFGYDYTGRPIGTESDLSYDRTDALSDLLNSQSNQAVMANAEQPFGYKFARQLTDTDSKVSDNRADQSAWNGVRLAGFKPLKLFDLLPLKSIPDGSRGGGAARPPHSLRTSRPGSPPARSILVGRLNSLQRQLNQAVPKHHTIWDFRDSNLKPTLRDVERMDVYVERVEESTRRYPLLVNRIEKHHKYPKYLGGLRNGEIAFVPRTYHQMITNEFRSQHGYGRPQPPLAETMEIMEHVYSKYPLPR